ncbi:hypothetical protein KC340_g15707 [Hortaea werneckii]|nr:hypothetical protein KC342_g16020 [Hortaea werneckii]KAI7061960.1 hypothetical protein KC339_g16677 [Hortaea werneckii]KAI7214223.1 hypothetical protein KC365_g14007 [Hortaea werneckii]KAI7295632.1 hypothetical protein KC340_g15707 [Hortaea werneckii]KAI7381465.1 hypothetical protein KC328_g12213 [Hortaea werneckii]
MPEDSGDVKPNPARAGSKRASKSELSSQDRQQAPKRSRVSRACDQCRASREKCDGQQPICQTCVSQSRKCSYDEQPKKRGIQPNYIRTLELTLSWISKSFPDSEKALAAALGDPEDVTRNLIAGKDSRAEALHQRWRSSVICRQIDQMLSGGPIDHPDDVHAAEHTLQSPPLSAPVEQQCGQTNQNQSDIDFANETQDANQPGASRERVSEFVHKPNMTDVTSALTINQLAGERLPLPENAWTLVEYYFAFVHAWLPVTDRQAALKLMYTYPTQGVLRVNATTGEYAELWSILALGSAVLPQPAESSGTEQLCTVARSLIPSERSSFELGHLKSLVLLSICEITRQQWLAAWIFIGSAVRVLLALRCGNTWAPAGLRSQFRTTESDKAADERLKRIGLAAYVIEDAIAAHFGAPTHLQSELVNSFGSVDEDGIEEWSPWHDPLSKAKEGDAKTPSRSYSTLNHLVRLTLSNDSASPTGLRQASSSAVLTTILRLLQNAMRTEKRAHPATIVSQCESSVPDNVGVAAVPANDLAIDNTLLHQDQQGYEQQQQLGYMSIPETAESAFSGSPAIISTGSGRAPQNDSGEPWLSGYVARPNQLPEMENSTTAGADIFEELAMLERTDSRSNPQFMQNLGFAPDIDLAEFFGADYQPSDPMLAYMQPSMFDPSAPDNG